MDETQRGSLWKLAMNGITKAKEHVAIHCTGMSPVVSAEDADLVHTLLLGFTDTHKLNKRGQDKRACLCCV